MKKVILILSVAALMVACNKGLDMGDKVSDKLSDTPITFSLMDMDAQVSTKAITDITSTNIGSIYVSASSGTAGSAEAAWSTLNNSAVTINSSGSGTSSAYWPASGSLSFYATSWSIAKTIAASGATSAVTYEGGTSDHVAGFASAVANKSSVAITMNHIYSRLYDIKLATTAGATATVNSVSVTPALTKGTYTFRTNAWTSTSTAGSAISIAPTTTAMTTTSTSIGQSAVDRTFIPGNVTISVTYTVTRSGFSKQYTKSAVVALPQGQKSTVTATLSDDASPISFTVTVTPWTTGNINATLQ